LNPRPLTESDIPKLAEVDAQSGLQVWSPAAWTAVLSAPYLSWVVEQQDAVLGYLVARSAAGEAELLRVAVSRANRRKGMATELLWSLLVSLRAERVSTCFLEVRAGNTGAIALYHQHGFVVCGKRSAYYPSENGKEDAVLMRLDLD